MKAAPVMRVLEKWLMKRGRPWSIPASIMTRTYPTSSFHSSASRSRMGISKWDPAAMPGSPPNINHRLLRFRITTATW
jgi:hypothetical protein